jgi:nucleotidyltransferase substrate binding protein (TIGR01987 family)
LGVNLILDVSSLESAASQLEKALQYSVSDLAKDKGLFEQFRNSTVQCFEFTYELAWKFLQRKLEQVHPNPQIIDELDFKDLIRECAQRGFIQNPEIWFDFRRLRNISSHAHDKTKAEQVYVKANALLMETHFLLKVLSK